MSAVTDATNMPELESAHLEDVFTELNTDIDTGENSTTINAAVSMTFSGTVTKENAQALLENALEHCREEGLLSDPEWLNDPATEELACDSIRCRVL